MPPRLWQRQPDEAPADFSAFITYLRLRGRRSHRTVATQTGRSLGAIRRLSAQFNWLARVAAFEARLADASQDALDLLVHATSTRTTADHERLRESEFQLAQSVLQESRRWLQLASDPRRRNVSLGQVCRVIDLATKLGRLAAGMPTGDEPRRRPRREDAPGYWTGPSVGEALEKIYGSPASVVESGRAGSPPPAAPRNPIQTSTGNPPPAAGNLNGDPSNLEAGPCTPPPPISAETPVVVPEHRRRDAWAAWARSQCRAAPARQT